MSSTTDANNDSDSKLQAPIDNVYNLQIPSMASTTSVSSSVYSIRTAAPKGASSYNFHAPSTTSVSVYSDHSDSSDHSEPTSAPYGALATSSIYSLQSPYFTSSSVYSDHSDPTGAPFGVVSPNLQAPFGHDEPEFDSTLLSVDPPLGHPPLPDTVDPLNPRCPYAPPPEWSTFSADPPAAADHCTDQEQNTNAVRENSKEVEDSKEDARQENPQKGGRFRRRFRKWIHSMSPKSNPTSGTTS
ncbi:hypothetical protein V8E54_013204 [Elaphomyces granulatus]